MGSYASPNEMHKNGKILLVETLYVATFFGKETPLQINVSSVFYFSVTVRMKKQF